jgi:hypothetical protein
MSVDMKSLHPIQLDDLLRVGNPTRDGGYILAPKQLFWRLSQ